MAEPIAKVGDKTDVQVWNMRTQSYDCRPGTILEVIEGGEFENQYVVDIHNVRHRLPESNISTPYGPWDDIEEPVDTRWLALVGAA